MEKNDLKLLQGTLDLLVLNALRGEPQHGYGVATWIRGTTSDRLSIEDGALYTALHRMERKGWLQSQWGLSENNRRAKFYSLTLAGRKRLEQDARIWTQYAEAVFMVLRASQAIPAT